MKQKLEYDQWIEVPCIFKLDDGGVVIKPASINRDAISYYVPGINEDNKNKTIVVVGSVQFVVDMDYETFQRSTRLTRKFEFEEKSESGDPDHRH